MCMCLKLQNCSRFRDLHFSTRHCRRSARGCSFSRQQRLRVLGERRRPSQLRALGQVCRSQQLRAPHRLVLRRPLSAQQLRGLRGPVLDGCGLQASARRLYDAWRGVGQPFVHAWLRCRRWVGKSFRKDLIENSSRSKMKPPQRIEFVKQRSSIQTRLRPCISTKICWWARVGKNQFWFETRTNELITLYTIHVFNADCIMHAFLIRNLPSPLAQVHTAWRCCEHVARACLD